MISSPDRRVPVSQLPPSRHRKGVASSTSARLPCPFLYFSTGRSSLIPVIIADESVHGRSVRSTQVLVSTTGPARNGSSVLKPFFKTGHSDSPSTLFGHQVREVDGEAEGSYNSNAKDPGMLVEWPGSR